MMEPWIVRTCWSTIFCKRCKLCQDVVWKQKKKRTDHWSLTPADQLSPVLSSLNLDPCQAGHTNPIFSFTMICGSSERSAALMQWLPIGFLPFSTVCCSGLPTGNYRHNGQTTDLGIFKCWLGNIDIKQASKRTSTRFQTWQQKRYGQKNI